MFLRLFTRRRNNQLFTQVWIPSCSAWKRRKYLAAPESTACCCHPMYVRVHGSRYVKRAAHSLNLHVSGISSFMIMKKWLRGKNQNQLQDRPSFIPCLFNAPFFQTYFIFFRVILNAWRNNQRFIAKLFSTLWVRRCGGTGSTIIMFFFFNHVVCLKNTVGLTQAADLPIYFTACLL